MPIEPLETGVLSAARLGVLGNVGLMIGAVVARSYIRDTLELSSWLESGLISGDLHGLPHLTNTALWSRPVTLRRRRKI